MLEDKGNYKSVRASQMYGQGTSLDGIAIECPEEHRPLTNKLSLSGLLTQKPTNENYEEVMDILAEIARKTYEDYKFFIARSPDETTETNFIQIACPYGEMPDLHRKVFALAINYGLDMQELQSRFAQRIEENKVIDIGDEAVVILNDGTNIPPTGVSQINKGLEGGEITFIISFIQKANLEAYLKNTFPEPDLVDAGNGE